MEVTNKVDQTIQDVEGDIKESNDQPETTRNDDSNEAVEGGSSGDEREKEDEDEDEDDESTSEDEDIPEFLSRPRAQIKKTVVGPKPDRWEDKEKKDKKKDSSSKSDKKDDKNSKSDKKDDKPVAGPSTT